MKRMQRAEQVFFRTLNSVVEPAVRKGVASSRWTPGSVIVLETTGYISGNQRRTPLLSVKLGKYRLISTSRGDRSFWMKNLKKDPAISYYLGGKKYSSRALLIEQEDSSNELSVLPTYVRKISRWLAMYKKQGWAFALLTPV